MTGQLVRVQIPASLRRSTGGIAQVEVQAASVRDAVNELERLYPGLRARLCAGDRLRPQLSAVVGSQISSAGLLTPLKPGDELTFVPAVAGG